MHKLHRGMRLISPNKILRIYYNYNIAFNIRIWHIQTMWAGVYRVHYTTGLLRVAFQLVLPSGAQLYKMLWNVLQMLHRHALQLQLTKQKAHRVCLHWVVLMCVVRRRRYEALKLAKNLQ